MPKLPDKIADWTPPWAEGEFDEDRAKALVFNALRNEQKAKETSSALRVEKDDLVTKLAEAEDKISTASAPTDAAKDAEINRLKAANRELEKGRPEDQDLIARLTVAMDHGLTSKDAKRLVGKTPEELEDDAIELAERLGVGKKEADPDDDSGRAAAPPQRTPVTQLGNGRQRTGEAPPVVSAADLIKTGVVGTSTGLNLAPLTR